uniref:Tetratricopeptide repeat protein n=1 Tax=Chlamydomonas leiostraca TaxID=1034604 RepID=A0A7S0WIG4_9CHLO
MRTPLLKTLTSPATMLLSTSGRALAMPILAKHKALPRVDRWGTERRENNQRLYDSALEYARRNRFKTARSVFNKLLLEEDPHMCCAWVSWAQMEKRANTGPERWDRCREVLQRGLTINPKSACLIQAFGLMCLQRGPGHWLAAVMLLERCVSIDPRLEPVLNWAQVSEARKTVGSRRRRNAGALSNNS